MAASTTDALRSGLNLMRRLPPKDVRTNLSGLTVLRPDLSEEWLQRVDAPLAVKTDTTGGAARKYLLCDYNRDGDSYRSPWSNAYDPPLADGFTPSPALRALELEANEVWSSYKDLYYEASGSISSVYMWDLDKGFAGCWLIKKGARRHRHARTTTCAHNTHIHTPYPTPGAQRLAAAAS